ncbi:MAG TPA: Flp family type IVb pilin [Rhizomicrobium sp.]
MPLAQEPGLEFRLNGDRDRSANQLFVNDSQAVYYNELTHGWGDIFMKAMLAAFASDQAGVTAIEYGLIAALLSLIIIGAVSSTGERLRTVFNTVAGSL